MAKKTKKPAKGKKLAIGVSKKTSKVLEAKIKRLEKEAEKLKKALRTAKSKKALRTAKLNAEKKRVKKALQSAKLNAEKKRKWHKKLTPLEIEVRKGLKPPSKTYIKKEVSSIKFALHVAEIFEKIERYNGKKLTDLQKRTLILIEERKRPGRKAKDLKAREDENSMAWYNHVRKKKYGGKMAIEDPLPKFVDESPADHALRIGLRLKKDDVYNIHETYKDIADWTGLSTREVFAMFIYIGVGDFSEAA